ncbi:aldehyde dehydrogenase family protein [Photorhabdus akhurstii]|uniref:aldehyde dehydrogenase family protein n=1 Tax=Photorhabdus akhurstii TaxID=171438 RepID=UPI001BD5DED2|nr:aldehyde dehydrogenase family protein [Photorhabdus akhurstii]MBS9430361.1 aldehyde dehydrogenase family protein [Photorhabdus akhurstii]
MKWYVKEALEINQAIPYKESINIEAGFGPTGLPHIGTLCEILRANLIKTELEKAGRTVNFYLISDDLDPFRKVPLNIPNAEKLTPYLGQPISKVPDPFGNFPSFSEMAEYQLMKLAAEYEIECQLVRNSLAYQNGDYNDGIKLFLQNFSVINQICKASTGSLRQRTYSMIMPISERTGAVLEHIIVTGVNPASGEITYYIPGDEVINKPGYEYGVEIREFYKNEILDQEQTISVLNGKSKLQWKADWGMRLLARNIHFEMHGEDLLASAAVARQIAGALNRPTPRFYKYGLFLDDSGKKISKSKGNSFSLDDIRHLLTRDAIRTYLSKEPQRSSKFYVALAPHLNDQVNISQKDRKRLSFSKIARILHSSKPASKFAAENFLNRYKKPGESISDQELEISYHYYIRTCKHGNQGLQSIKEGKYFSAIANSISSGEISTKDQLFQRIISTYENHFSDDEPSQIWSLLYRGLFGDTKGPRIKTWLDLNCMQHILTHFNNPYKKPDKNQSPKNEENIVNNEINSSQKERLINNSIEEDQIYMTKLYSKINFTEIRKKCDELSSALQKNREALVEALSGYQCKNVTEDEILRSIDVLNNIENNRAYFKKKIYGVTSFLPLNQPIYASVCFGFIPSLMAENVCIRPPTAMHTHYKKFEEVINLSEFSPTLSISYEDKELFLSQRVKITDAVIFTGTPENALKVRKHFRKNTLFILNGAGHNPLIISKDADINLAVESAKRVVLYNQGQDCAGPNAILVHNDIYDLFKQRLISDLKNIEDKIGPYSDYKNIVGPNSDIDHSIKIASVFKVNRPYCTYGGEVNPINGMIKPTVFEKELSLGGNYKEFFAPVFFLQRYYQDQDLIHYFSDPLYSANAMYISLFGTSDYIHHQLSERLHLPDSILSNTDLHLEEHGYLPYGGQGPAASCLWYEGNRISGSTLPQRDIYHYLIEPFDPLPTPKGEKRRCVQAGI